MRIGLNLQVAQKPDEVDFMKEEIAKELSSALGNIRLAERGVYVQASTLGALEALLDFLKSSKIPVSTYQHLISSLQCMRAYLREKVCTIKFSDFWTKFRLEQNII